MKVVSPQEAVRAIPDGSVVIFPHGCIEPTTFYTAFQQEVEQLEGVSSLHHLHCWSLDGESHVLTLHVLMEADISREGILRVKRRVRELLSEYPFKHVTMEFELEGEVCCLSDAECEVD